MIRIAHTLASAQGGGAETFCVSLALALHERGSPQHVALKREAGRVARLAAGGVPFETPPFLGGWDGYTRWRLKRAFQRFKPDVVVGWLKRACVLTPPGAYARVGRVGGYYNIKYYQGFDHLIALTPLIYQHLTDAGWPAEKLTLIPNFCRIDEGAGPVPRAAHDTPEDAPLLLALGRLHQAKALDVLLDAVAQVPGAYVWIAGSGPDEADLRAQADRLGIVGRVRFLGWRTDRSALLAAADLCVFPSRFEPFGTVTVEAWGHRVPLVATDSDGPRSMITPGRDALLVPRDDADALAAAIGRVLASPDLAAQLVAEGHRTYTARYHQDRVVDQYLDCLGTVARAKAAA